MFVPLGERRELNYNATLSAAYLGAVTLLTECDRPQ